MYVPAKNTTDRAIPIDFEGRVLAGGEWGVIDRHDDVVEPAVEAGDLVIYPSGVDDVDGADPEAVRATELAKVLEDRRRHFDNLEVGELRDHAAGVDLLNFRGQVGEERARELYDERDKAELVRLVARRLEVPLTTSPPDDELPPDAVVPSPLEEPPTVPESTPRKAAGAKKTGGAR